MTTEEIPQNPFMGPRTFRKEDARFFFGRDREAQELLALIVSERLVMFYAQSGAGKSSLINAKVLPQLVNKEGFAALPVGRVSGQLPPDFEGDVDNIFSFNLMLSLDSSDTDPQAFAHLTLPEFLSRLTTEEGDVYTFEPDAEPFEPAADSDEPPHILIIDQFEEIINTNLDRWEERDAFFHQLDAAMAADPFLWVVLTLREDYVPALAPYAHLMRNNLRDRYYMQRMGARAARQAIEQPAALGGRPFADGVAKSLVDNLRQIKTQTEETHQLGQFVEPVQLQVVCYQLWNNLAERPVQPITHEDVAELGDVNTALAQFYEQVLRGVFAETEVSEIELRNWFDQELITEAATRGTVYQGAAETAGLPNNIVRLLANRFLLRSETRAGGQWFELVHDRFVEPILEANRAWREQQAPIVRAALSWEEAGRPENQLLTEGALAAVKATQSAGKVEPLVASFIAACEKADQALREKEAQRQRELQLQKERADEQERRVKTTRRFLALTVALLVVVVGAAVYALIQRNLAIDNEERAIAQTTLANAQGLQRGNQLQLSTLLAIVSLGNEDTLSEAGEILRQNVSQMPEVVAAVRQLTNPLTAVVYHPDGNELLTANLDQGYATFWDGQNGDQLKRFERDGSALNLVAISPDGESWAAVDNLLNSDEFAALIYNIDAAGDGLIFSGDEPQFRLLHEGYITDLVFSPDGTLLATASRDQTVHVWDVATGIKQHRFELGGATNDVVDVTFSPDGRFVLAGGGNGHIWALNSGREIALLPHDGQVLSVAFSPDGSQVATTGTDRQLKLWDAATGELILTRLHNGWPTEVVFSSDGRWLATASDDNTVRLWDTGLWQENQLYHDDRVVGLTFSPNGRWLASIGADRTARLWDPFTGYQQAVMVLEGVGADLTFKPDGTHLATTTRNGSLAIWNIESVIIPHERLAHPQLVDVARFNEAEDVIYAASDDLNGYVWPLNGQGERLLMGHNGVINDIAVSADGTKIATVGEDMQVIVWDSSTEKIDVVLPLDRASVEAAAFNLDGTQLTSVDRRGQVVIWDIATGERLHTLSQNGNTDVFAVTYHPDGNEMVTGVEDGRAFVWNTADVETVAALRHGDARVTAVAYTADGSFLLTGSLDGLVKFWDVAEWRRFAFRNEQSGEPLVHPDAVLDIAVDAQGEWVATASADGYVRIWELETRQEIARIPHGDPVTSVDFSMEIDAQLLTTSGDVVYVWPIEQLPFIKADELVEFSCARVARLLTDEDVQLYVADATSRDVAPCEN